jgi:hypothetical protein
MAGESVFPSHELGWESLSVSIKKFDSKVLKALLDIEPECLESTPKLEELERRPYRQKGWINSLNLGQQCRKRRSR